MLALANVSRLEKTQLVANSHLILSTSRAVVEKKHRVVVQRKLTERLYLVVGSRVRETLLL